MSEDNSRNHDSSATHQRLQHSTTLNRRYVQRPEPTMRQDRPEHAETIEAVAISSFAKCQAENLRRRQELAEKINRERLLAMKNKRTQRGYVAEPAKVQPTQAAQPTRPTQSTDHVADSVKQDSSNQEMILPVQELPMQRAANERLAQTWPEARVVQQPTAQELKDEAIRKAMRSVATMEASERKAETKKMRRHQRSRMQVRSRKRIALAIACAVAVVGGIGYFVATNIPSVSYGAMAMQSGIDLSKMWVPRDFSLITSSAGEGSLSVTYAKGDTQFMLTAEVSAWDSQTLLSNYVEKTWRGYDTVKEQGKTIYISGSNAAWVSGGVRYILEAGTGTLTNKQIKSIATSL